MKYCKLIVKVATDKFKKNKILIVNAETIIENKNKNAVINKIKTNLKLKLAYKNESNIKSTHEFESNFNYNYANTGANLRELIDASTAKVEEN